ncbi:substrate-binding periplasmic protein [Neptuniibacter halophilus]|uniref:substrate-binding periplasmic protein n=1 Tax=Neptuniibacter halophilus TaxID=651666 RepID=UPI00257330C1|nr:ABC transporter substrate-binding protein [Neptuniibacter halophilus]
MRLSLSMLALLLISLNLPPNRADAASLQILTVDEPPSNYQVEQNGTLLLKGFAVEIVQAIQKSLGDYAAINLLPESRVIHMAMKQPNIALFSISRTTGREAQFHWITQVGVKQWVFYARGDFSGQPRNLEALDHTLRVAVVRGDIRESWLQQQGFTNLLLTASPGQSLRLLRQGRADLVLYEPQGVAYASRQQAFAADEFKPLFTAHRAPIYLAMSKGTHPKTVQRWQAAAESLHQSGVVRAINLRWADIIRQQWGYECQLVDDLLHC